MEQLSVSAVLLMGLGWGMLHAFDPDHLAAVAGVSAADGSTKTSYFRYAFRWSIGHGAAIASVAFLLFVFGLAMPDWFSIYAESSVAFILIVAGSYALYCLMRLKLVSHSHQSSAIPQRSALLIGLVHGAAGSAPLLALIPLVKIEHPLLGLAYVLCFSAGVLVAMCCSGGVLSYSLRVTSRVSEHYQRFARLFLALFSISVGIYLLF